MSLDTFADVTVRPALARVDLLPPGLDDARRWRRTQLGLAGGLLAVVGLVGVAHGLGAGNVAQAEEQLGDAQARTTQLQVEQRRYAEVPQVEQQVETAEAAQQAVNASVVDWSSMLDSLAANIPARSSVDTVTLALDATATAPGGSGTTAAADPLGVAGIGTVALTGVAADQDGVASVLEGLARVPGLAHPLVSSSGSADGAGGVQYTTSATITPDALLNQP